MHEAFSQHKVGEVAQTSNPSTQKVKPGESEVEGRPRLQRRERGHQNVKGRVVSQ